MNYNSIEYALLAMQNALIGEINPNLRAVIVDIDKQRKLYYMRFYVDGSSSKQQIEDISCIMTEASAALTFNVNEDFERLDYPRDIPERGRLAYLRKEPITNWQSLQVFQPKIVNREIRFTPTCNNIYKGITKPSKCFTKYSIIQTIDCISYIFPARPTECNIEINYEAYAVLSLQKSLLGKVIPELRAVITEVKEGSNHVFVRFFYDTPLIQEMLLEWEEALSEVMADFGEGFTFDMSLVLLPYPNPIPFQGRCVYLKKEGK